MLEQPKELVELLNHESMAVREAYGQDSFGQGCLLARRLVEHQVRAVEVGMPLIRAANNGISAVVDEKGRVIDGFAVDAVGSFDVALFVPDVQSRPEIDAGRNGLLIILFFATLACGMNIGQRLRSK